MIALFKNYLLTFLGAVALHQISSGPFGPFVSAVHHAPTNDVHRLGRRAGGYPDSFDNWGIWNKYVKYFKHEREEKKRRPKPSLRRFPAGREIQVTNDIERYAFISTQDPNLECHVEIKLYDMVDSGGFGEVYEGTLSACTSTEEVVAVKITNKNQYEMLHGDQLRSRILSPNVLDVLGSFWIPDSNAAESGEAFSVMPLIQGADLWNWRKNLKRQRFPQNRLAQVVDRYFLEILDIAANVTEAGVFHRDLKPENIMYSNRNNAFYIIDFDTATEKPTTTDYSLGTVTYSCPGQIPWILFSLLFSAIEKQKLMKPLEKIKMQPYDSEKGDVFALLLVYIYLYFPAMAKPQRDETWKLFLEPMDGLTELPYTSTKTIVNTLYGDYMSEGKRELLARGMCRQQERLRMLELRNQFAKLYEIENGQVR